MKRLFGLLSSLFLVSAIGRAQVDEIVDVIYEINNPPTASAVHAILSTTHSDAIVATAVAGDLFYFNGTGWARFPIGTNTYVLTVSGGLPTWAAAAGGGAPTDAGYWTDGAVAGLSAERSLGGFTGLVLNTAGAPSAYAGASCTNQFLRSLNVSGAGTCASIVNADITNTTIDLTTKVTGLLPHANIANGSALSLFGRAANSAGVMAPITATAASDCAFRESGSTLGCGTLATAAYANDSVTLAKIQNIATARLLGRTTASSGDIEELSAGVGLALAGGGLAVDTSGITTNEVMQPASDTYPYYDSSGAAMAKAPVGLAGIGRGGARCYDEVFPTALTGAELDCSITASRVGTGSGATSQLATAGHFGVQSCATGTDTTGACAFQAGGNATTAIQSSAQVVFGGGRVLAGVVGKLNNLSDGTETYKAYFDGFSDQAFTSAGSAEAVDGIYFRYTHSVNSGEWEGVARANSVETVCDTNVAADTSYHTFQIDVNAAATSVDFWIDGTNRCTVASNVPTGTGRETTLMPIAIQKSAGTTTRLVQLDAFWYLFNFDTPR